MLHRVQDLFNAFRRRRRVERRCDFQKRDRKELIFLVPPAYIASPVDERNDVQRQATVFRGQLQVRELLGEEILERLRPFDDVLHRIELTVAEFVEGSPARSMLVLVEGTIPIPVEGLE